MSKKAEKEAPETVQMDVKTYLDNRLVAISAEIAAIEQRHASLTAAKAELMRMRESVVE